jgi:hypothetical protein
VNIAARLEGIAEPGGVCVSDDVKIHALNKINAGFIDLGEQTLKNIPRAIRAYRLGAADRNARPPAARSGSRLAVRVRTGGAIAAATLLLLSGAALVRQYWASRAAVSPNALAGIERRFDPAAVPLVTDRVRSTLADYVRQPDFKAIAISRLGWGVSSGLSDAVGAERDALDRCRKQDPKGDCRIYAVGDEVVWPQTLLPLPADLHSVPLDIPLAPADISIVKGMPSAAGLDAFLKKSDHKALAVGEGGFSTMDNRSDVAEAIRLAVERCSDFAKSPCLLASVDGFLTVRVPHSYGIVRPYTLAGDTEMSNADKERIGSIYGGTDWRALAKGGSGRWYGVAAADSETAAVDQALASCRQAETACGLRAIGNFRIDKR